MIKVADHPLIIQKISLLRKQETSSKEFRHLINEISLLLGFLATEDLDLRKQKISFSPIGRQFTPYEVKDRIGIFPILRAGLGMVDGLLNLLPKAQIHHLGLYREKVSLLPVEYYNKLPQDCQTELGYVLDPMVATAGTAVAALNILKDWGLVRIKFICILASRDGLKALHEAHPDVDIYVAAVDEELDEHGYIQPGLGDAGDRQFNTSK